MEEKLELAVKLREVLVGEKKKWTTAYQNSLPDSCFMYVCPGGSKKDGFTTPRNLRKLVYKDDKGKIDKAHVINALGRLNQVKCGGKIISQSLQDKIRSRLQKALAQVKKGAKSISLGRIITGVSRAFDLEFSDIKSEDGGCQYYVSEVLDDAVIVDSWDEWDTYYRVKYTKVDNSFIFVSQEKWIKGRYQFVADEQ